MTVSQNGWIASPNPADIGIAPCSVEGIPIGDGLAAGPPTTALLYVLGQFHRRVEPLVPGTNWGYKYREIIGGGALSNHASGTAADANADKHPLGQKGTFTAAQVDEIHRILAEVEGSVRWGGDYAGRVDEMHFEIIADPVTLAGVAARLGVHMQILDYSAGYPGGAAVAQAGYGGVTRYLRKEGTSVVKPITPAELADMTAHGLLVALLYEHVSPSRANQGRIAGQHDALWADARANELPAPGAAITFTVDFDAEPSTVAPYFQGCCETIGVQRVGVYGSFRVVEYILDHGLATYAHQCAAWSHGQVSPRAHLYQRIGAVTVGGISCDVNDVLKPNFGPINQGQDDDMTPEQDRQLYNLDRLNTALLLGDHEVTRVRSSDGTGNETLQSYPLAFMGDLAQLKTVSAQQQQQLDAIKAGVDALVAKVLGNPV